MKKINKLIAILLVGVCVLSGCAGSNTGKQEETVTMRATVTSFEKAGFLVTPEDGSEELKSSDSCRFIASHAIHSPCGLFHGRLSPYNKK